MNSPAKNLTITERPYFLWFTGAIFCGLGLVMLLLHEGPAIMGIIILLIGLLLVVNSPVITVILDRNSNLMVVYNQALIRQHTREIPLDVIVNIELQRRSGLPGIGSYRMVIITHTGTLPLTGYYRGGKAGQERQLKQIRQFIGSLPVRGPVY